jgi:alpha-glucosidase
MADLQWWQRGVVYQIYPRSFMDWNGDGVGDLQGILDRLDYLNDGTPNSLGVDIVWLSPIYPSPMADFGYDVADYCDVDPLFGDLATFDRLVAAVHRQGMKIIIDWVPNHTSDRHPWFACSRSSRDNPFRDWYIWRDAKPDGSPPNNWGSFFGGTAWTLDDHTGQYYLHQFAKEQPELNWRNPCVEQAMHETLRFWLKRGVDGFRMDVIGLIVKDQALRDNPIDPQASPALPKNDLLDRLILRYNLDQDEVHPYLRRIRGVLDEFDDRVAIGELWGPLDRWVRYYGERNDELQLPFNFRLINLPWTASAIRASVDEMEAALPPLAWPNYVLGNHDQARLATRLGGEPQARLAAMLLLTLRGTPTLYYGDELGMPNTPIPHDRVIDPLGRNLGAERNRDVCRTPMQWDESLQAGFSTVEPWLPVPGDYASRTVSAQDRDKYTILNLYRQLIGLRRGSAALTAGSYHPLDASHTDVFAYMRESQGESKLVVLNFSGVPLRVDLPIAGSGKVDLSTYLDRRDTIHLPSISLRPHEGLLISVLS